MLPRWQQIIIINTSEAVPTHAKKAYYRYSSTDSLHWCQMRVVLNFTPWLL